MTRPARFRMVPEGRVLRARRAQRAIWFLAMAFATVGLFLGCGDRQLVLNVDVESFLEPSEKSGAYGPVPAGLSGSTGFTQSREVNLLSGVEGVVSVQSVDLYLTGVFDNRTGSGNADLVAVFRRTSGEAVDSLVVPIQLQPARADTLEAQLGGSPALAQLLSGSEVLLDLRLDLVADPPPGNADPLAGDFELTRFIAVVVARRDAD